MVEVQGCHSEESEVGEMVRNPITAAVHSSQNYSNAITLTTKQNLFPIHSLVKVYFTLSGYRDPNILSVKVFLR